LLNQIRRKLSQLRLILLSNYREFSPRFIPKNNNIRKEKFMPDGPANDYFATQFAAAIVKESAAAEKPLTGGEE
jgi:hypothetical protein